jgi:aerobic carbon-monoxide dehydrogenase medium subunit
VTGVAYHPATSVEDALDVLGRYGEDARIVAGGTAMVVLLKNRLVRPAVLLGVIGIPGLDRIRLDTAGVLEIGAAATLRAVELDPLVRQRAAALAEVVGRVATVRVRNQATLGGNIVHADPAQDPPPMLLALDASVVLEGAGTRRSVPLDGFYVDLFETAMRHDEILTAIVVPPPPEGARFTHIKFLPRTVDDFATVSVAVRLQLAADGTVEDLRIALGGANSAPFRAKLAEAALRGRRPDPAAIDDAAALARDASEPFPDVRGSVAYKREMVRVWVARALTSLAQPAGHA